MGIRMLTTFSSLLPKPLRTPLLFSALFAAGSLSAVTYANGLTIATISLWLACSVLGYEIIASAVCEIRSGTSRKTLIMEYLSWIIGLSCLLTLFVCMAFLIMPPP